MSAQIDVPTRRWAIMQIARELFTCNGFEQTAASDICRRLTLSEADFYEHFQSMDDLLEAVWAAPWPSPVKTSSRSPDI